MVRGRFEVYLTPGVVSDNLKRIAAKWKIDLEALDKIADIDVRTKKIFHARRMMLTQKIIVMRNNQMYITRQWLEDNSS